MQSTDAEGLEERVSTRFPTGWRFSSKEEGYATAIRAQYKPNGGKKVVVLVQLQNGNWRVGVSKGMDERWAFDRVSLEDAEDTLIEVVQLYEAYRVVRENYPRDELHAWSEIIDARLRALANIGPAVPDDRDVDPETDPLDQVGLDSFTKASEIRA